MEDQYHFIPYHLVMEKETDDKVAVKMIRKTQESFPEFKMCSFDKGYHRPANRAEGGELLDLEDGRAAEPTGDLEDIVFAHEAGHDGRPEH